MFGTFYPLCYVKAAYKSTAYRQPHSAPKNGVSLVTLVMVAKQQILICVQKWKNKNNRFTETTGKNNKEWHKFKRSIFLGLKIFFQRNKCWEVCVNPGNIYIYWWFFCFLIFGVTKGRERFLSSSNLVCQLL